MISEFGSRSKLSSFQKKKEGETLKFVPEERRKRNSLAPEYVCLASPFIKETKRELLRKNNPNVINCEKSA